MKLGRLAFLFVLLIATLARGATYTTGPGGTISDAFVQLNPGDTLVLKNGQYPAQEFMRAWKLPKPGTPSAWITVRAETPGGVIIDNGGNSNAIDIQQAAVANRYLWIDGIVFRNQESGAMFHGLGYVKVTRCGFHMAGNGGGNTVCLAFSKTTMCLAEENWTWGAGRTGLMMGGGTKNIARRHVGRLDYINTAEPIDGVVSFYNGTDCEGQNLIGIDCDQPYQAGEYGALFTVPTTGGIATRCVFRGSIGINANIPLGLLAKNGVGILFDNCIAFRTSQGIYCRDPLTVTNSTFVDMVGPKRYSAASLGFTYLEGGYHQGQGSVSNSIVVGVPGLESYAFNMTGITRVRPANLLSAQGGASVLKKIGKSGTLWGEPGWNAVQAEDLWPFPNEQIIRDNFRTSANGKRGFCADNSPSLTSYVMAQLGGTVVVPPPPPPPPPTTDPKDQLIMDLQAQVASLQTQLAAANMELSVAQLDITAKQTKIAELSAQVAALQAQVDQLNTKIAAAKAALN